MPLLSTGRQHLRIRLRGFQHQQQPFHPKSPTDGGGWGTSQLADQAVITSTTADCGLSPELMLVISKPWL